MKKIVGILTLILIFKFQVKAQIFYSETFNGVTAPALPAGWVATVVATPWVTSNASASTPTPPYSGGNNIIVQNCGPNNEFRRIQTPAISTVGRTNIILSYGILRQGSFPSGAIVTEYSINGGGAWNAITIGSAGSATWSIVFATLPVAVNNLADVRFRWSFQTTIGSGCGAGNNFRIDNVTLGQNSTLPLTLSFFTASNLQNTTVLRWQTETETNTSAFLIERSYNGTDFTVIGTVDAARNSTTIQQYKFTELNPKQQLSYYRLKIIDADGKYTYSTISKINVRKSGFSLNNLYPQPASNQLVIEWNGNTTSKATIVVRDMLGKLVQLYNTQSNSGFNQFKLNTSTLLPGQYSLQLITDTEIENKNFIKQ